MMGTISVEEGWKVLGENDVELRTTARDLAQSSSNPCPPLSLGPFLLLDAIFMKTVSWTLSS
jgi:hypothetical protein